MKRQWTFWAVLGMVVVIASVASPAANAALQLQVDDVTGGVGVIVPDNAPQDLDPTVGVILFHGAVGRFNLNVDTSVSTSPAGLGQQRMDLNGIDAAAIAGRLQISTFDSGYHAPGVPPASLLGRGQVGGTLFLGQVGASPASARFEAWVNQVKVQDFTSLSSSYSSTSPWTPVGKPNLFDIRSLATFDIPARGMVSYNQQVDTTAQAPEPSTFVVWSLLGGLGIALGYWRRKRAA